MTQCTYSSPAVANGVVYVGAQDGYVYAVNAMTGELLWRVAAGTYVDASPVVVNGMLFVATYDGNVLAFSLNGHESLGVMDGQSRK